MKTVLSHPVMWGLGTLGNISGNYMSISYSKKSNMALLRNDWRRIGKDMQKAIFLVGEEIRQSNK